MTTLGTLIAIAGFAAIGIGGLWFLITAFLESILWGLICLFTGVGNLIFLIIHWRSAKRPFLLQVLGVALVVIGGVVAGRQGLAFVPGFSP